ncbi:MAG: HlyC/CorC family transporter [Clostridiales bacterium]|nr:HlyC/CorC family transporter [Clostridiales bacterium]
MPDDDIGRIIINLLIVFVFVLVNAFFSATEIAVISLNDNKIKRMAEEGHKGAKRVMRFIDNPGSFLATIQVGVTFAGFLSSAFAADKFTDLLYGAIDPAGKFESFLRPTSMVVITLILSYFSLVLGELVPKRVAQRYPDKVSFLSASVVRGFGLIMKPFVKLLTLSTNAVLRVMGIDPHANNRNVTEEEIRMMVDVGSESGSIEDDEKLMIKNVFEFNDKEASEIMTHRRKIVSLPIDADIEEVMKIATEERFTRIPVYRENIDDIVGILHIKDLLAYSSCPDKRGDFSLQELIRRPLVAHENKKISSLFREMKKGGLQMAVIVDEYGGTMGIATIEDVIEEIVGNITDEFDKEEQELVLLPDGDYMVLGDMTLNDLENAVGIDLPDEDYDTIAGLAIQLLDRIPNKGENPEVQYKNIIIRVEQVQDKWISKLRLHILPEEEEIREEDNDEE